MYMAVQLQFPGEAVILSHLRATLNNASPFTQEAIEKVAAVFANQQLSPLDVDVYVEGALCGVDSSEHLPIQTRVFLRSRLVSALKDPVLVK